MTQLSLFEWLKEFFFFLFAVKSGSEQSGVQLRMHLQAPASHPQHGSKAADVQTLKGAVLLSARSRSHFWSGSQETDAALELF